MHVGVFLVLFMFAFLLVIVTDNANFIWGMVGVSVLFLMTTRGTKK